MVCAADLPYAFECGGKACRGHEGVLDWTFKVSVERREFPDFPGADWYAVWFENVGDKPRSSLLILPPEG